ncbi:hypothetical protein [Streptomyces griseoluteus]
MFRSTKHRARRLLSHCAVAAGGAGKVLGSAIATAALPFLPGIFS